MGKTFIARAKIDINQTIKKGFQIDVPSVSNIRPNGSEIEQAVKEKYGSSVAMWCGTPEKWEILG